MEQNNLYFKKKYHAAGIYRSSGNYRKSPHFFFSIKYASYFNSYIPLGVFRRNTSTIKSTSATNPWLAISLATAFRANSGWLFSSLRWQSQTWRNPNVAFSTMVWAHSALLKCLFCSLCGSSDTADKVLQRAFRVRGSPQ